MQVYELEKWAEISLIRFINCSTTFNVLYLYKSSKERFLFIFVPIIAGLGYPYFLRFIFPFINLFWVMIYGYLIILLCFFASILVDDSGFISRAVMIVISSIPFTLCFLSAAIFNLRKCYRAKLFGFTLYVLTFFATGKWISLFLE